MVAILGAGEKILLLSYGYAEPGAQSISIDAIKFGGEYTGTVPLSRRRHWFAQFNVRPAFTIEGFSDVSFSQPGGWALRASEKYQVTRRWSLEPFYVHWNVRPSPANDQTVTFTVNQVTVRERIGLYEPFNTTDELGVKLGFRF